MSQKKESKHVFEGNIFVFHAFDVGDDINLEGVESSEEIMTRPLHLSKYFKNYHIPLSIDLPHPHSSSRCISTKIHSFGAISFVYQIPFQTTLENLKKELAAIDAEFQEQSVEDVNSVFKKIKRYIKQPRLFNVRNSYVIIQTDQDPAALTASQLKEQYGGIIASLVRFETASLSEFQKNEILEDARGYYRGDLIIIDNEAAFIYDDDYEEILDLFEFANIQELELRYYDQVLDRQLNIVYQREMRKIPMKSYLPFIGTMMKDPVSSLALLKVDISAIIERLQGSIKIAGDTYVSETYEVLVDKLEIPEWKESINNKLEIIKDIHMIYKDKTDAIREDLLTVLIIILIFIELIVGILGALK